MYEGLASFPPSSEFLLTVISSSHCCSSSIEQLPFTLCVCPCVSGADFTPNLCKHPLHTYKEGGRWMGTRRDGGTGHCTIVSND